MKKGEYIAIETANYGYVVIELKELKEWIFQLSKEDLMRLDFTEEELKKVKKLFLRNEIRKTYSPLVYDFALSMINEKANEVISLYKRRLF